MFYVITELATGQAIAYWKKKPSYTQGFKFIALKYQPFPCRCMDGEEVNMGGWDLEIVTRAVKWCLRGLIYQLERTLFRYRHFIYLLVLFRNQHRFILGTSLAIDQLNWIIVGCTAHKYGVIICIVLNEWEIESNLLAYIIYFKKSKLLGFNFTFNPRTSFHMSCITKKQINK